jgi:hypothetical protein
MERVEIAARPARRSELAMRLRGLLLSPRREWALIAAERPDPVGLYARVVLPLAAIPPAAKLIAWSLLFGFLSLGTALAAALAAYLLSLAGVFVLAWAAARLAPYFDGEERFGAALKLIAYAATVSWLGGILRPVPVVGALALLADLYSLYLIACGAPALLAVPPERRLAFTATIGLAALGLFVVAAVAVAALLGMGALGMA